MEFSPIGVIRTPHVDPKGTPIQSVGAVDIKGLIDHKHEYIEGLKDLDGFSHLILLYHFHRSKKYSLKVKPYLEDIWRGIFATRYPACPNPIGLSVVRLSRVKGNKLYVLDVDMLDGPPLLDIKPFIPEVDNRENARIGWLEKRVSRMREAKSDGRIS